MSNKLFVGSLSFSADSAALEQLFSNEGKVLSAKVIEDKHSGRSKGFGFVEMSTPEEAQAAIQALDRSEFMGREISVSIAKPQENRERRPSSRPNSGYRNQY